MLRFSKENVRRVADNEITAAREYRDKGIQYFRGEKDMENMYRADCRTRVAAARLAKKGQFQEAWKLVTEQDTAARDEVTDEFWDLLYDLNGEV